MCPPLSLPRRTWWLAKWRPSRYLESDQKLKTALLCRSIAGPLPLASLFFFAYHSSSCWRRFSPCSSSSHHIHHFSNHKSVTSLHISHLQSSNRRQLLPLNNASHCFNPFFPPNLIFWSFSRSKNLNSIFFFCNFYPLTLQEKVLRRKSGLLVERFVVSYVMTLVLSKVMAVGTSPWQFSTTYKNTCVWSKHCDETNCLAAAPDCQVHQWRHAIMLRRRRIVSSLHSVCNSNSQNIPYIGDCNCSPSVLAVSLALQNVNDQMFSSILKTYWSSWTFPKKSIYHQYMINISFLHSQYMVIFTRDCLKNCLKNRYCYLTEESFCLSCVFHMWFGGLRRSQLYIFVITYRQLCRLKGNNKKTQ